MNYSQKAKRLTAFLEAAKLSQREVAKAVGVTGAQISNIVREERDISEVLALALEHKFNVSSEWLLLGKGTMFLESRSALSGLGVGGQKMIQIFGELKEPRREKLIDYGEDLLRAQRAEK